MFNHVLIWSGFLIFTCMYMYMWHLKDVISQNPGKEITLNVNLHVNIQSDVKKNNNNFILKNFILCVLNV